MLKHVRPGKTIGLSALFIALVLVVAACGGDSSSNEDSSGGGSTSAEGGGEGSSPKTMGASMLRLRDPDLAVMLGAMEETADEDNVDLTAVDANGDPATELNVVENLITSDPEAIVMMPVDAEQSETAAQRVNEADIPLFILSTRFAEDADVEWVSYIGIDDTEAGEIQGEWVNEQLPQGGTILYLVGTYGASWTDRRKEGFEKVLNKNIEIADELQTDGDRAKSTTVMEDLIQKYPNPGEIDGIVTQTDETSIGAGQAIKQAGKLGDYGFILGVDGTQPGLEAIADGIATATVLQKSAEQGSTAIKVMNEYLEGVKVKPEYDLEFEMVEKDNVDEFLK